ncbi:SRPBCC domain-containing protein [Rhodobacter sp. NTK016B]|uniref:SRPBCC domain-containing protein n=1 Tax=Rhodobacter sp. NTK016B TaxID=2759676 RepID=UPI001A8F1A25|nr:SRPBCC domain-containing protein [Rhodobacter sp. NTK016B]MBN8293373.1 SRPBCC domain-containing protein [Rhodobacter sp. NTK016B]
MNPDEITHSIDVPVPPERAWALFVHHFPDWWPREHCFCGEAALDTVFIDLDKAQWGEITRSGDRDLWGAVLLADAGRSLSLGWQMDATVSPWVPEPDPARASVIDITFAKHPDGTRVTLRHHGFSRQGEPHAQAMRDVMIGLKRWQEWLEMFCQYTAKTA